MSAGYQTLEFPTVAEMIARDTLAAISTVKQWSIIAFKTIGYATPGDGGGAEYYWDPASTETHNGGTVLQIAYGSAVPVLVGRIKVRDRSKVNVLWFHATGGGVVDDAAAINAAITAVVDGGEVYFPRGTYKVATSILLSSRSRIRLRGECLGAVRIVATSAVISATLGNGQTSGAVVTVLNSDTCTIENLWIEGSLTASAFPSAIESRRDSLVHNCSALTVRNCKLGSDSGVTLLDGIRYTCASLAMDQNNENGYFENVTGYNLQRACLNVEHSNALFMRWKGGTMASSAHAVRMRGGSFTVEGAAVGNIGNNLLGRGAATALVDFGAPVFAPGFYDHPSSFNASGVEATDMLINTDAYPFVRMLFHGNGVGGVGAVGVNFLSAGNASGPSSLTFRDFGLICGAACTVTMGDVNSRLIIEGCGSVGFTSITWNGQYVHRNNDWQPGSVTLTPGVAATELYSGESGAGYGAGDTFSRGTVNVISATVRANYFIGAVQVGYDLPSQRTALVPIYSYRPGVGVTKPLGVGLLNDTAAALGAQQAPAVIEFEGRGWATGAGASQQALVQLGFLPVQSAVVDGIFQVRMNLNNAGFLGLMELAGTLADGNTAMSLLTRTGATITTRQVSVGAADSGGAGFRLLRVPN